MKVLSVFFLIVSLFLTGCSCSDCDTVVSQKFIHKYGFEVDEREWQERAEDGRIESYLDNGVAVVEHYENGKLHGTTTYSFPYSSTIEKLLVYDQGELLKEVVHDRKGVPIREEAYEFDGRRVVTHWDEKGAPMRIEEYENDLLMEGTYYNPTNEVEARVTSGNGTRTKRARNGTLLLEDHVQEGTIASRTTFHPNQEKHIVSHFNNYQLHGEQKVYTADGELSMINNWKDGLLDGLRISFRNGHKVSVVPYVAGKCEGVQRRYDEEGNLLAEIAFHDDKKHGKSSYYHGNERSSEWFYHGALSSKERFEVLESKDEMVAKLDE